MDERESNDMEKIAREQWRGEYLALAQELSEVREGFPFPGITPKSYLTLKVVAEQFPEYAPPIDELVAKFQTQGLKVVLVGRAKEDNVFILPLNSDDIDMDNLFPRHLVITEDMDERLKKLVLANIKLKGHA